MSDWNGIPDNHENSGCHWVVHEKDINSVDGEMAIYWNGTMWWLPGSGRPYNKAEMKRYKYLGPCLTPKQVEKLNEAYYLGLQ